MEPRKNVQRFIERARRSPERSVQELKRIEADRLERYTRSGHRMDQSLTPEEFEARDSARLKAFEKRRRGA